MGFISVTPTKEQVAQIREHLLKRGRMEYAYHDREDDLTSIMVNAPGMCAELRTDGFVEVYLKAKYNDRGRLVDTRADTMKLAIWRFCDHSWVEPHFRKFLPTAFKGYAKDLLADHLRRVAGPPDEETENRAQGRLTTMRAWCAVMIVLGIVLALWLVVGP